MAKAVRTAEGGGRPARPRDASRVALIPRRETRRGGGRDGRPPRSRRLHG